jgi:ADP-ribose pyrophosphatase YjhB (NUDIX family)/GNAT superfamily N-acetyltransferase
VRERGNRLGWLIGAGVEIVAPDGRLLMIEQERLGVVEWSGTGGALEPGESIEDCARREALEESGLHIRLERLIRVTEFWQGDTLEGLGFLFLGTPDPWPQDVRLPAFDGITHFSAHRWCTREEVDALPRWPHHVTHLAWPTEITSIRIDRVDATPAIRIRRGRPDEADELTALAGRSKAHWGYDADFMERIHDAMSLSPHDVETHEVWVLEDGTGRVIGFHRVIPGDPAEVEDLWVEPDAMGTGHGRRLFEHAVAVATSLGASAVELDADPNARGFYERMGMVHVGDTPSTLVPGRTLPRMRIQLSRP